ncbi:MAG: hypothetical protein K2X97_12460 [Mycobacteriaceae bacterium]|nr:hypothetical protein [Mycobacteriaceae bacterium]
MRAGDARPMLTIRAANLVDGRSDTDFRQTLDAMNAPLTERINELAHRLCGRRPVGAA